MTVAVLAQSPGNGKSEWRQEKRTGAPGAGRKDDMKKEDPDIQALASRFEKGFMTCKASFTELKFFPARTVNTATEVEWVLDELVEYPKGMHQRAGSEKRPGRILIRLEFGDPSQPTQRAAMKRSGASVFFKVDTANEKLKRRAEAIMASVLP